jgi:hypothetical protein
MVMVDIIISCLLLCLCLWFWCVGVGFIFIVRKSAVVVVRVRACGGFAEGSSWGSNIASLVIPLPLALLSYYLHNFCNFRLSAVSALSLSARL